MSPDLLTQEGGSPGHIIDLVGAREKIGSERFPTWRLTASP